MDESEEAIVTRLLINKSNNTKVEVRIYKPVQDGDDWCCTFIIGSTKEKAYGVDSMQAHILSIDAIRHRLENISDNLYWLDKLQFLGFPLFIPMYLPDEERKEIEATLKSEIDKLLESTKEAIKKRESELKL